MTTWMICPTCQGKGKHSRALGVVNPEDFSSDEWEDYLEGGYDSPCTTCSGSGKVSDKMEAGARHARQLAYENGVNEAGERLW